MFPNTVTNEIPDQNGHRPDANGNTGGQINIAMDPGKKQLGWEDIDILDLDDFEDDKTRVSNENW